ncbi:MAG: hypothetical protein OXC44_07895 [Proteobacteria bacterium]|nr:hypothetical protein [Pseudomonadota bacterium]
MSETLSAKYTVELSEEDRRKQKRGWYTMVFFMLFFPALFFLCVYFPIWVGWISRFP